MFPLRDCSLQIDKLEVTIPTAMYFSLRFMGILVCSFAIIFCVSTCSVPDILAASKTTDHCHTEKENPGKPQPQKFCCSGEAILSTQTPFCFVADQPQLIPCSVSTIVVFSNKSTSMDFYFFQDSSPPDSTVLRI